MAEETKSKKGVSGGLIAVMVIVALGLVVGAFFLFSKGSKTEESTTTSSTTTSNSGLSGLLSGLNLNGLHISAV